MFLYFFAVERFYKGLYNLDKTFWGTTKKYENKNLKYFFFKSGIGIGTVNLLYSFRYRACFDQGVPWHSSKYIVWIYSERCTWHDKNNSQMHCTDKNSFGRFVKWLSVRLRTKWLWIWVPLQSGKLSFISAMCNFQGLQRGLFKVVL